MRHGSLFSGIGGFDLAAQWAGWTNVFQVEWDEHCQAILKKNFPHTEKYGDIDKFDGTQYRGAIDILSGGPPCQPASQAGKRKGESDDRWKWPEAIRVLGEIRPRIAVFENPDDILTLDMGRPFERICSEMESIGYKVETYGIPAACVGAWHERDRIWIIAYANSNGSNVWREKEFVCYQEWNGENEKQSGGIVQCGPNADGPTSANTHPQGLQESTRAKFAGIYKSPFTPQGCEFSGIHAASGRYWETEPGVGRMVHGLPNRVDRIKSLGNAIVPQVAFEIFKAIIRVNNES